VAFVDLVPERREQSDKCQAGKKCVEGAELVAELPTLSSIPDAEIAIPENQPADEDNSGNEEDTFQDQRRVKIDFHGGVWLGRFLAGGRAGGKAVSKAL
jgi:hypothetical protein